MRSTTNGVLVLFMAALLFAVPAYADSVPSTLQIGPGNGTLDPVLVNGSNFTINQNQGGAGTITTLTILFSVPNINTASSPVSGLSILGGSGGTIGSFSYVGTLTSPASPSSCTDVYSCAGLPANASNNFTNFSGADQSTLGITATEFGIYEVTITGTSIGPKGYIQLGANMPLGTFIDGYGVVGDPSTFATPFTEAGVNVPEPGSLTLLGTGLLALAGFLRGRSKKS